MYDGGEIIIINNIIFNNNQIDHAYFKGRPCIVISECNDKLSLLPLTSNYPKSTNDRQNTAIFFRNDFFDSTGSFKLKQVSYSNLSSIFQRELRYYDVVSRISYIRYARLLKEINEKKLDRYGLCKDIYLEISDDLRNQNEEYSLLFRKKL